MAKKMNQKLLTTNFYEANNADVYKVRKQLAKVANQRMLRLERTQSKVTGESYTFGAYTIAQDFLIEQDRHRFSESIAKDRSLNAVLKEISVLQKFLTSASSSVGGMHKIEKARIETFESKGIKFASTKEFYDFLNSASFEYLATHGYDSEQIIEVAKAAMKNKAKKTWKDMEKALDKFRLQQDEEQSLKNMQKIMEGKRLGKKKKG